MTPGRFSYFEDLSLCFSFLLQSCENRFCIAIFVNLILSCFSNWQLLDILGIWVPNLADRSTTTTQQQQIYCSSSSITYERCAAIRCHFYRAMNTANFSIHHP